jgi:hypothetical protein
MTDEQMMTDHPYRDERDDMADPLGRGCSHYTAGQRCYRPFGDHVAPTTQSQQAESQERGGWTVSWDYAVDERGLRWPVNVRMERSV